MARIIDAFTQFFDDAGDPLVNGYLKFLESGTNNTDKDTFNDPDLTTANTNPVSLDASGRCPSVFGSGSYNVISYTSDDVQIQQFDPVGGNATTGQLSEWESVTTYGLGDLVRGSDGEYYRSLTSNNQNNNPVSSSSNWEMLQFGRVWNSSVSYSDTDSVYGSDGRLYFSLTSSNQGNDPTLDTAQTNWFLERLLVDKSTYPTIKVDTLSPTTDIEFGAGRIYNSDSTDVINTTSSMIKQIDAPWAEGSNAGGLFFGSVAADTAYACFEIVRDSDGYVDRGFDDNATADNIPSGYTAYRRIGWVMTNGSSEIINFHQNGDLFYLDVGIADIDNTNPGTGQNTEAVTVPPNLIGLFTLVVQKDATANVLITATRQTNTAPSNNNTSARVNALSQIQTTVLEIEVDDSREIRYRSSLANMDILRVITTGFVDQRLV